MNDIAVVPFKVPKMIRRVIETTEERQVSDNNGAVRPYRTRDNKFGGAVLTVVDIGDLRRRSSSANGPFRAKRTSAAAKMAVLHDVGASRQVVDGGEDRRPTIARVVAAVLAPQTILPCGFDVSALTLRPERWNALKAGRRRFAIFLTRDTALRCDY